MKKLKKPNFQTACDTCAHLRGGPAGRDERDTAWVWECFLDQPEFYESGDSCPEQSYRADADEKEYENEESISCPHCETKFPKGRPMFAVFHYCPGRIF